jgi:hypothetical protein
VPTGATARARWHGGGISVAPTESTGPAPARQDEYRPDPDRWIALGVVLAAGFMTLLDVSIVNVALPSMELGLHAQQNALQWIVAGYALSLWRTRSRAPGFGGVVLDEAVVIPGAGEVEVLAVVQLADAADNGADGVRAPQGAVEHRPPPG